MNAYYQALTLTLLAGLSTGLGSALAIMVPHTNKKLLTFALGFSAGIMLYVAFVEIMPESRESLLQQLPAASGGWITTLAFFGGILLIWLIDHLVPDIQNPHEPTFIRSITGMNNATADEYRLHRTGIFMAGAIAVHNLPEGLAVFFSTLSNQHLGILIAITIALHNIPVGMAIAVPIYAATKSKTRAFSYSFLTGLAEPVGAVIGYALLKPYLSPLLFGIVLASVAGIMVYIALDELLPAAEEYGDHHTAMSGLITGMAVMAASLLMLG